MVQIHFDFCSNTLNNKRLGILSTLPLVSIFVSIYLPLLMNHCLIMSVVPISPACDMWELEENSSLSFFRLPKHLHLYRSLTNRRGLKLTLLAIAVLYTLEIIPLLFTLSQLPSLLIPTLMSLANLEVKIINILSSMSLSN